MGSRAAVGVANGVKGTELAETVAGVIALSYPLHTQDNKSNLRDTPLYELSVPICFISGASD
jgi:predicted alpha/beta-hydrolase family hydrolase